MNLDADMDMQALFQEEASSRLSALSDHVLLLERDGANPELLTAMFREAHTIKGSAAMVGLEDIAREAHVLEELLDRVRSGDWEATPDVIDTVLGSVDRLFTMAAIPRDGADASPVEAASAEPDSDMADDDDVDTDLDTAESDEEGPLEVSLSEADLPELELPDTNRGHAPYMARPTVRRETARVAVERLDDLVRLSGEATAANLRLATAMQAAAVNDPLVADAMRSLSRVLLDLGDRTLRARMIPIAALSGQLRRAVRDLARKREKEVRLEIRGDDTELDRNIHEQLSDALVHLVRNAVDHGIERPEVRRAAGKSAEGTIVVHAMQLGSRVIVTVSDDGGGIDTPAVRAAAKSRLGIDTSGLDDDEVHNLLFRSGFTTTTTVNEVSGRGVGLDAVREVVESLRGRLEVHSTSGQGTSFRIVVPVTLAVLQSLIVGAAGRRYALGMHNVRTVLPASTPELVVEGGAAIKVGSQVVPLVDLPSALGDGEGASGPILVMAGLTGTHAFRVDVIEGQRELVMKRLPPLIPTGHLIVGGSAEPDGTVMLVLDAEGLIEAATEAGPTRASTSLSSVATTTAGAGAGPGRRARVLVVDDALTVRELQRSILERAGYEVRIAVDGMDGLARLAEGDIDIVLTDIEMPRMDGLELTRTIRAQPQTANLPIVVLTTRSSDDDRQAGMDAGADAYIVKSQFSEAALVGAVESLLGGD